jgi:hypothetical protein
MILHAASIAAFFVDQLTQAPVVVQCAQASPEPSWKWLVQTLSSIIPVAGGVGIAWMAFRWNSRKEHTRWILDQKKAEWRELLDAVKTCELDLAIISVAGDTFPAGLKSEAKRRAHNVQILFRDRIFINEFELISVLSAWIDVTDRINIPGESQMISSEYISAFTALVDAVRLAARKDLGVPA